MSDVVQMVADLTYFDEGDETVETDVQCEVMLSPPTPRRDVVEETRASGRPERGMNGEFRALTAAGLDE